MMAGRTRTRLHGHQHTARVYSGDDGRGGASGGSATYWARQKSINGRLSLWLYISRFFFPPVAVQRPYREDPADYEATALVFSACLACCLQVLRDPPGQIVFLAPSGAHQSGLLQVFLDSIARSLLLAHWEWTFSSVRLSLSTCSSLFFIAFVFHDPADPRRVQSTADAFKRFHFAAFFSLSPFRLQLGGMSGRDRPRTPFSYSWWWSPSS